MRHWWISRLRPARHRYRLCCRSGRRDRWRRRWRGRRPGDNPESRYRWRRRRVVRDQAESIRLRALAVGNPDEWRERGPAERRELAFWLDKRDGAARRLICRESCVHARTTLHAPARDRHRWPRWSSHFFWRLALAQSRPQEAAKVKVRKRKGHGGTQDKS